jgi:hypothetical protein
MQVRHSYHYTNASVGTDAVRQVHVGAWCEVIGHTKKTRTLFATHNVALPETSPSTVVLLGAPLLTGERLDTVLDKKQELSC